MHLLVPRSLVRALFGDRIYVFYLVWKYLGPDSDTTQSDIERITGEELDEFVQEKTENFPKVSVYRSFKKYLRDSRKLYPATGSALQNDQALPVPQVAPGCGHLLHPGDTRDETEVCHVCIVNECTDSLGRILAAWQSLDQEDEDEGSHHAKKEAELKARLSSRLMGIWCYEKLNWANMVHNLENYADNEVDWELANYAAEGVNGAGAALVLAWKNSPDLFAQDKPFTPMKTALNARRPRHGNQTAARPTAQSPKHPSLPRRLASAAHQNTVPQPKTRSYLRYHEPPAKKTVRFSQEGLIDHYRNRLEYDRGSPNYQPGRHACSSPGGWEDTSFFGVGDSDSDEDTDSGDSDSDEDTDSDESDYPEESSMGVTEPQGPSSIGRHSNQLESLSPTLEETAAGTQSLNTVSRPNSTDHSDGDESSLHEDSQGSDDSPSSGDSGVSADSKEEPQDVPGAQHGQLVGGNLPASPQPDRKRPRKDFETDSKERPPMLPKRRRA